MMQRPDWLLERAAAKVALVNARLEGREVLPSWAGVFHAGGGRHGAWELQTLVIAPDAGFVHEWPLTRRDRASSSRPEATSPEMG